MRDATRKTYLKRKYGNVECFKCHYALNSDGSNISVFQEHHIDGHHKGNTVLLCLNCHVEITTNQHKSARHCVSKYPPRKEILKGGERVCSLLEVF